MKNKVILTFLLLSYLTVSSYSQQKKTEVTYVGNAGFLIEVGDKKILIDALFKGFEGSYELPQEVQDKLTSAQAPFNDVDLILVTHAHGDHIDPDMVRQHLQNNPKAFFASTEQIVNALDGPSERCFAFNPTKGKSESKVINDIRIESFYFPHGANSRIINIGFLISVNGVTLFETGDFDNEQYTFEEFRSLQLPEKKIDLAFIQHYYLTDKAEARKFVEEGIGAKYLIPIHYHFTTPAFNSILIKQNYPDAITFKEELQSWKMPIQETKFSNLKGDYLGQTPPGNVPIIFAPGIISVDSTVEHGYPTFAPDGNMVFWQSNLRHKEKETEIFHKVMRRMDGQWTEPESSPYGGMPAYSPDGNKLYFISDDTEKEKGLYFVEKQGENWTEPKSLNIIARFPELKYLYAPSVTNNGTLYFLVMQKAWDQGTILVFTDQNLLMAFI